MSQKMNFRFSHENSIFTAIRDCPTYLDITVQNGSNMIVLGRGDKRAYVIEASARVESIEQFQSIVSELNSNGKLDNGQCIEQQEAENLSIDFNRDSPY